LYKTFLEWHTINSNPRFAFDLGTAGEGSLLLVATCSPSRLRPRVNLMAGSLLLLLVVVAGSLLLLLVVVAGSLL
jgi:hypothetical protein